MTLFTEHPGAQGLGYVTHLAFAAGIALRLLRTALAFAVHAIFPFLSIEPRLDLEATSSYLLARNQHVEQLALTSVRRRMTARLEPLH
jgi:hypothetical protein